MTSLPLFLLLALLLLLVSPLRAEEEEKELKCNFEKRGEVPNPEGTKCISFCTERFQWVRGSGCVLKCASDETFNKKTKKCEFICNNDREDFFFDEVLGSCEFLPCPGSKNLIELEPKEDEDLDEDAPVKCGCKDESRVFKNLKRGCVCKRGFLEISKTCVPETLLDEKLCIEGLTFYDPATDGCICPDGAKFVKRKKTALCRCPYANTRFVKRDDAEKGFCKCKKGFVEEEGSRDCVEAEA